jgi:hypothetical protein
VCQYGVKVEKQKARNGKATRYAGPPESASTAMNSADFDPVLWLGSNWSCGRETEPYL